MAPPVSVRSKRARAGPCGGRDGVNRADLAHPAKGSIPFLFFSILISMLFYN
jgi:hypothetical protein